MLKKSWLYIIKSIIDKIIVSYENKNTGNHASIETIKSHVISRTETGLFFYISKLEYTDISQSLSKFPYSLK